MSENKIVAVQLNKKYTKNMILPKLIKLGML